MAIYGSKAANSRLGVLNDRRAPDNGFECMECGCVKTISLNL